MNNKRTIFSVIVTRITQVSLCKQKNPCPSSPLTFHFFSHIFSLTIIFCVTSPCLSCLTNSNATLLPNTRRWLSQILPVSIRCSGTVFWGGFFWGFFSLIHLCRSYSLCQSVSLSRAHKYLFVLAASLLTRISPLLSPELRPQGL